MIILLQKNEAGKWQQVNELKAGKYKKIIETDYGDGIETGEITPEPPTDETSA